MSSIDIFGHKSATAGESFSSEDAYMSFPGITDVNGNQLPALTPLLLQNAAFAYQQQITRLFDLASSNIYYVRGRAQGTGQLGQVLGPAKLSRAFMHTYGNVCNAATNQLNFTMGAGCKSSAGGYWENSHGFLAKFVVIDQIGLQMTAEQMVIQQNVNMMISAFEYFDGAAPSGAAPSGAAAGGGVGNFLGGVLQGAADVATGLAVPGFLLP